MTARGPRRLASALVTLACLPALAACGSDEGATFQRIAFCQGEPTAGDEDGMLVVEWRQGARVVATASGAAGTVFSAEVPIGAIQIYVDGTEVGAVNEGVSTDVPWVEPAPGEATYLAGEGCPDRPFA